MKAPTEGTEESHGLTLAGSGGATLDGQAVDTVLTVHSAQTVVVVGVTITNGFATSFFLALRRAGAR